jgi:hypothetical protein
MASYLVSPAFREIGIALLVIVVLIFKPEGFFGERL